MTELPKEFKEMLHDLLGREAFDLIRSLDEEPITSIRVNKRKKVSDFDNLPQVPWCNSGYYLKERPEFIFDPLLHAGAYYVQDASSMIYETVTKNLVSQLPTHDDPDVSIKILDLCASPGGKTTAMINAIEDGTEITANEYTSKRVSALRENLERWGYPWVKITNKDSLYYAQGEEHFDIVAVDAPCSGEGMMRKDETARKQWSWQLVSQCCSLQKEILQNAVKSLKPGGFLIYSTCTFNRLENEGNAEFIANELDLEPVELEFKGKWDISTGLSTQLPVYRFMPHKTKGEGLFLCVFRKKGDWKPTKRNMKPEIGKETYPVVEVDYEKALAYLKRESIVLDDSAPLGLVTIAYKGLPLGPAKNIGKRANNLYPKNRRILKR